MGEVLEEGRYDVGAFVDELDGAPENLAVGTRLWFENDRVRVWEVRLEPGERAPFHAHTRPYFWTCVAPGRALQRLADGSIRLRTYDLGETMFFDHSPDAPHLHDLENAGDTTLRFTTVELL
ncbi:MAG: hypothetical protein ACKOKE_00045 [Actinomycetota bacterium]